MHHTRGFPDQSNKFDIILHNVEGGPILRRRKHPAPPLDDIDPRFHAVYDESLHGEKLRKELDLSHLPIGLRTKVYALLQKYWSVFDDKGQFIPVKDYKCSIDTGSARLICIKNINYTIEDSRLCFVRSDAVEEEDTMCRRMGHP